MIYVIARNASGRPTLMHQVVYGEFKGDITTFTKCGHDFHRWSRAYLDYPIAQIMCKNCQKGTK